MPRVGAGFSALGIAVCLACVLSVHREKPMPLRSVIASVLPVATNVLTPREIESHPVVSGGIRTQADLVAAFAKYPELYGGLNPAEFHLIALDRNVLVKMSYRLGDRILWTRNSVWVGEGTLVWTDGNGHYIKEACGNLFLLDEDSPLSSPLQTILPSDGGASDPVYVSDPQIPTNGIVPINFQSPVGPQPPPSTIGTPTCATCFLYQIPPVITLTPPVSPTPEPATLPLFITGLVLLFGFKAHKRYIKRCRGEV